LQQLQEDIDYSLLSEQHTALTHTQYGKTQQHHEQSQNIVVKHT